MKPPTQAALWLRASNDDQHPENQRPDLERLARARGLDVVQVYELDGSAWTGEHRRAFERALVDAHQGRYQVLLVWAVDRLSREGIEATLRAVRQLGERGVTVISHEEPWLNGTSEVTELLLAVAAWVAHQESKRRSRRIKAGVARRRAEGKPVGRQAGAKDKKQRKRSGYYARWERERAAKG